MTESDKNSSLLLYESIYDRKHFYDSSPQTSKAFLVLKLVLGMDVMQFSVGTKVLITKTHSIIV